MIKRRTGPQSGQGHVSLEAEAPVKQQAVSHKFEDVPYPASTPAAADDTDAIVEAAKALRDDGAAARGYRRCLVVDDSRVVRKLARKIAEKLGYRVAEAENGEEALARCRTTMPDLVITDWQMPIMGGPEFVAKFREIPGADRAKVMFCTSKGEATDIHEGISSGADDYIVKPFDEAKLTAKLERLVVG